jgi:hypothetical protein
VNGRRGVVSTKFTETGGVVKFGDATPEGPPNGGPSAILQVDGVQVEGHLKVD